MRPAADAADRVPESTNALGRANVRTWKRGRQANPLPWARRTRVAYQSDSVRKARHGRFSGCPICDEVAGRVVAPGGPIYDDGLWLVSHHTGAWTDPGEVLVKLRRHVESLAQVTPEESAALGPILRAGVEAIERAVGPERTYVMSFNERLRHLHFYILPRTRSLPRGHVMSDLYKRGRAVLRQTGITRTPRRRTERRWPSACGRIPHGHD